MFTRLFSFFTASFLFLSSSFAEKQVITPEEFQAALQKLSEIGIVTDAGYWSENAIPGKTLSTASMTEVVIAAAGKFGTVSTIEEAIATLHQQKILTDLERWRHELIDKTAFPGGDAQFLILLFAKKIN